MRYAIGVRTTIDIDDELLLTVKEIARSENKTAGDVVSGLLRESLRPRALVPEYRNGVPLLPRRPHGTQVTAELVNRLRDEDE
jgi:Arc/MetJ family transcription regulator